MSICTLELKDDVIVEFYYDPDDECVEVERVLANDVDITEFCNEGTILDRMYAIRENARWEHMMGADRDY